MRLRTALAIISLALPIIMTAANKQQKLYVYGFVMSFNDSTVYFTDVQELDSAWVDAKTGFLYSRDNYSYQLRDYMKGNGYSEPTCIISFAKSRKKVEKKFLKTKKRYVKDPNYSVQYIPSSDFSFRAVFPDEGEMAEKEKRNAEAKKRKEMEKQLQPDGERPQGPPPGGGNGMPGGGMQGGGMPPM